MRWFGASWGAPVCEHGEQVPVPVGQPCEHCGLTIESDDQGILMTYYDEQPRDFPVHIDCLLKMVLPGGGDGMKPTS